MWKATVMYKSIETGLEVRPRQTYEAASRIEVEDMFIGNTAELYKERIYATAWLESPIGNFFADPTGWSAIHANQMLGYGPKGS